PQASALKCSQQSISNEIAQLLRCGERRSRRDEPQAAGSLTLWIAALSLGIKEGSPRRTAVLIATTERSYRSSPTPHAGRRAGVHLTPDARRSTQEKKTR